jgi:hypothetical protein
MSAVILLSSFSLRRRDRPVLGRAVGDERVAKAMKRLAAERGVLWGRNVAKNPGPQPMNKD